MAYTKHLESGSNLPALQANAQTARLGLWAIAGVVPSWQYRAAVGPVTATNGVPAVNVSALTTGALHDRTFGWAEHKFPDHAMGGRGTTFDGAALGRCYAGNLCVRILARCLQWVKPDGSIVDVGHHGNFLPVIEAQGF